MSATGPPEPGPSAHQQDPQQPEPAGYGARPRRAHRSLYLRLLGIEHLQPNGWQRALLGEGAVVVGILLTLADVASAWVIVVLPVAVALLVKANDMLAGELGRQNTQDRSGPGTARTPGPRRDPASLEPEG